MVEDGSDGREVPEAGSDVTEVGETGSVVAKLVGTDFAGDGSVGTLDGTGYLEPDWVDLDRLRTRSGSDSDL